MLLGGVTKWEEMIQKHKSLKKRKTQQLRLDKEIRNYQDLIAHLPK